MAGVGFEDIGAGKSAISTVVGKKGVLPYGGISIHDLAEHSTFEETAYLLWYGRLPKVVELRHFCEQVWQELVLPKDVVAQLKMLSPDANPMSLLRTGVSLLGLSDQDEGASNNPEFPAPGVNLIGQLNDGGPGFGPNHPNTKKAIRLLGHLTSLVAFIQRLIKHQEFVEPQRGKSLAYNFLLILTGKNPDDETVRILDKCLVLHADHEFNASTFTARVAAGTLTDLHSPVVAAIGALKGPLHGGANTAVANMLLEIQDPKIAKEWVKDGLETKKQIMGFA